jgi:pimeloyl-ACP methyl ester carboxylesterase
MPELDAGGLTVHYATEGDGPPLILLHGATSMGTRDWGAQRPLLRKHFQLFMPDARGHGRTRWDVRDGWSPAMLVDDLRAFADALGLQRFRLMGLSMGGRTALAFAAQHPERVEALAVVSAANETEPARSVARRRLDPAAIERDEPAFAAELAARHDPTQGPGAWRLLLGAMRDSLHAEPPLRPESLARIRLPVLLVFGDRDPWAPLEQAVRLRRQLPEGQLLVVPGGHVVPAERPSVFNPAVLAFLQSPERRG